MYACPEQSVKSSNLIGPIKPCDDAGPIREIGSSSRDTRSVNATESNYGTATNYHRQQQKGGKKKDGESDSKINGSHSLTVKTSTFLKTIDTTAA